MNYSNSINIYNGGFEESFLHILALRLTHINLMILYDCNRIVGLYDSDENWIIEEQGVEKVAVDYFEDLFQTTTPTGFDGFLDEITPSITPQMNQRLVRLATEEEVRQALFMMHPEKAPGPDGMTALFFQHS